MTFQLVRAVSDGISRILSLISGILLLLMIGIQFLSQTSINTAVVGLFSPGPAGEIEATLGMTLPVSSTIAAVIFLGTVVFSSVYFVVLARTLTRPTSELSTISTELYTRRIGRASLTMLVGGFVVTVAVMTGTAFFFVPGIFLATCFLFFMFTVAVEDQGLVGALRRSWALSRGHRLKLSLLVIVSGLIGFLIGIVGSLLDFVSSPIVEELIVNTGLSVWFIILYGVIAAAYLQLSDEGQSSVRDSGVTEPLTSIEG